jgi:hypothetical protein
LLWSYSESEGKLNRTLDLLSTDFVLSSEESSEPVVTQSYSILYTVRDVDFKLALRTDLTYQNQLNYQSSTTAMGYAPINKTGVASKESIQFNSPVRLSEQYHALSDISNKLAETYEKSNDVGLQQLSAGYDIMEIEASHLSNLVKYKLPAYNKLSLNSSATLLDSTCTDMCGIDCGAPAGAACALLCATFAVACGEGWPICFAA